MLWLREIIEFHENQFSAILIKEHDFVILVIWSECQ